MADGTIGPIIPQGSGGGGKGGSPPKEAENTLRARSVARILYLISEGPIKGFQTVNSSQSVFLTESMTPVAAVNGAPNFDVNIQFRHGTPGEPHMEGFPTAETVVAGPGRITQAGSPQIRTIDMANRDRLRFNISIPQMFKVDDKGNMNPNAVKLRIEWRAVGATTWNGLFEGDITGKCVAPYAKAYTFSSPHNGQIETRVIRLTADPADTKDQNLIDWLSVTAILDQKMLYPGVAYAGLTFDAEKFPGGIPAATFDVDALICEVPTNYDPVTRTYTGVWNGTFKREWTNNPAWVFWTLATDPEFGAGRALSRGLVSPSAAYAAAAQLVDKWTLYSIAQYCDELVPNGFGGTEPRYSVNAWINNADEAYRMLAGIASGFRAMLFWGGGKIVPVADRPGSPVKLVTPANIIGDFMYEGTAIRSRHSVVRVRWRDPNNGYREAIEVVDDPEMMRQVGVRPVDYEAVGCTSRGQARRMGRWILFTEKYEDRMVRYVAATDHANVVPGDLVLVQDPRMSGVAFSGRLAIAPTSLTSVRLDRSVTFVNGVTYQLRVVYPSGSISAPIAITNGAGAHNTLSLGASLAETPLSGAVWLIVSSAVAPQSYRVLSVRESADEATYEITGALHYAEKYAAVEENIPFDTTPFTTLPTQPSDPLLLPSNLTVEEFVGGFGTTGLMRALFSWSGARDARVVQYEASVTQGDNVVRSVRVQETSAQFENLTPGSYVFSVRAIAVSGQQSTLVSTAAINIDGMPDPPAPPTSLTAVGSLRQNVIRWTDPTSRHLRGVEVWASASSTFGAGALVGESKYGEFLHTGLGSSVQRFYWARAVDNYGQASGWIGPVNATTNVIQTADIGGGQVSDAQIASGVTGSKISGALSNATLAAGGVTGQLTDAQLGGGYAANLIGNSCASRSIEGWIGGWSAPTTLIAAEGANPDGSGVSNWSLGGFGSGYASRTSIPINTHMDVYWGGFPGTLPVVGGRRYEWQARIINLGAPCWLIIGWTDAAGNWISEIGSVQQAASSATSGRHPNQYSQMAVFGTAPANAVRAVPFIRLGEWGTGHGSLVRLVWTQALFGEARANQSELSPWVPGGLGQATPGVFAPGSVNDALIASGVAGSKVVNLPTGNLLGLVTDAQIATGITGSKVSNLPTTNLSGTISNAQVATGLDAAKLTTGILDQARITVLDAAKVSGSLTTATLPVARLDGLVQSAQIAGITAAQLTTQITATNIATDAVTAPKILAGSVTTAKIEAGAITASKLTLTTGNLNPDPFFQDWGNWWLPDASGWLTEDAPGGAYANVMGVRRAVTLSGGGIGTARRHIWTPANHPIATVQSLRPLRLMARCRNDSNQGISLDIQFFSVAGAFVGGGGIHWGAGQGNPGGLTNHALITPPAGSAYWRLVVYNLAPGSTFSGVAAVSDVTVQVAADASLIVDGSIQSNHLRTDTAVITNILQVGANTVGNTQLTDSSVSTGKLQANSVTASRIAVVGDTSNLTPDPLFEESAAWTLTQIAGSNSSTWLDNDTALGGSFGGKRRIDMYGTGEYWLRSKPFAVTSGAQYWVRATKWCSASGVTQELYLEWLNPAGVTLGYDRAANSAAAGTETLAGSVTAPNGAVQARTLQLRRVGPDATLSWGPPFVWRRGTAELIVDGAITAAKIGAGQVTAAKLGVVSDNVIWNSCCTVTADGWIAYGDAGWNPGGSSLGIAEPVWGLASFGAGRLASMGSPNGPRAVAEWNTSLPILEGQRVAAAALIGNHRFGGGARVQLVFYNSAGGYISEHSGNDISTAQVGGNLLSGWGKSALIMNAPSGARFARVRVTATSNGQLDPVLFFTQVQLSIAPANATEIGEWTPGGITAITGGVIVTDSILARHIAAGQVKAAQIDTDAVTAAKIQGGAVSANKLGVGFSGNLISNSCLAVSSHGWTPGGTAPPTSWGAAAVDGVDANWRLVGRGSGFAYRSSIGAGAYMDVYFQLPGFSTAPVPVLPSTWYEAQVRLQAHRCTGELKVAFYDINNAYITEVSIGSTTFMSGATNGRSINDYALVWGKTQSPSNARFAMFFLRASIATGADPYVFWTMAYLGLSPGEQQTEPTPWAPGGLTTIEGGMIATDAVVARHIATDAVTAGKIQAGAVTAGKVAANAITANEIATNAITATKIATDAIQTRSLLVAPGNICPDGFFYDVGTHAGGAFWEADATGWYAEEPLNGAYWQAIMNVRRALIIGDWVAVGTARRHVWSRAGRFMPASAGQQYRLRAKARSSANQTIFCALVFYDWQNTYIGLDAVSWTSADGSPAGVYKEKTVTAPAGSAYMRVAIYNDGGTTFAGMVCLSDIQVEAAVTATMVVQGNAVITGSAQVQDLIIGTTKITDNAITTLAAGSFAGASAAAGSLNYFADFFPVLPAARDCAILVNWRYGLVGTGALPEMRLYANGSQVRTQIPVAKDDNGSMNHVMTLPGGTNTLRLASFGGSSSDTIFVTDITFTLLSRAK